VHIHSNLNEIENIKIIHNILFLISNIFFGPLNNIEKLLNKNNLCKIIFENLKINHFNVYFNLLYKS